MKKYIGFLLFTAGCLAFGISTVNAEMNTDTLYGNIYHAGVTSREIKLSRIYAEYTIRKGLKGISGSQNVPPDHPLKSMENPEIYGMVPIPLYMGSPSGGVSTEMASPGEIIGLQWSLICENGVTCGAITIPISSYEGKVRFNFDYLSKKYSYSDGGYVSQQLGWNTLIKREGWGEYAQIRAIYGGMIGFKQMPIKETTPNMVYSFKNGLSDGIPDIQGQYLENKDISDWWKRAHMKIFEDEPTFRIVELADY